MAQLAFSATELRASNDDPAFLARAWALKESVGKAFGTGFRGIGWRAIELLAFDASTLTVRAPFGATARDEAVTAWRADVVVDGDRVIAAVVASRGPVRLSSRLRSPKRRAWERAARDAQLSCAARAAAQDAVRDMLGADPILEWGRTPRGAPLLSCRKRGPAISVSLAHGSGAAVALVGVAGDGADLAPDRALAGQPVAVDFALDDELLRGVRAGSLTISRDGANGVTERGTGSSG